MIHRILCVVVIAVALSAAENAEQQRHRRAMERAQSSQARVSEALDVGNWNKARRSAGDLLRFAEQEELFWRRQQRADALRAAAEHVAVSKTFVRSVQSRSAESARAAFDELNASCRGCHDLRVDKK